MTPIEQARQALEDALRPAGRQYVRVCIERALAALAIPMDEKGTATATVWCGSCKGTGYKHKWTGPDLNPVFPPEPCPSCKDRRPDRDALLKGTAEFVALLRHYAKLLGAELPGVMNKAADIIEARDALLKEAAEAIRPFIRVAPYLDQVLAEADQIVIQCPNRWSLTAGDFIKIRSIFARLRAQAEGGEG